MTRVRKTGGDYTYEGEIVAQFTKRSGAVRFVVEDDRGLLLIMNGNQIQPVKASPPGEAKYSQADYGKLLDDWLFHESVGAFTGYEDVLKEALSVAAGRLPLR
jgi:hypothetical protein